MGILDGIRKIKSKKFMEAIAAGCAMVACADGLVRPEETSKMIEFIKLEESLQSFDIAEVIVMFENYVQFFEMDNLIGKEKAVKTIEKIRNNRHEAKMLVLFCRSIGGSDEELTHTEAGVIREICMILGLNPREYPIQPTPPPPFRISDIPKPKPEKKDAIPDWMKQPPPIPKKSRDSEKTTPEIPDWMKPTPKTKDEKKNRMKKHHGKKNDPDNIPDWMKKS